MNNIVLKCPMCSSAFQVTAEMIGQAVACPTCGRPVLIPDSQDEIVALKSTDDSIQSPTPSEFEIVANQGAPVSFVIPAETDKAGEDFKSESTEPEADPSEIEAAARQAALEEATRLLPPKFQFDDPESLNFRRAENAAFKIRLPDSDGGTQTIDARIVRVEHKGQMIELIALTPEQRRRRRRISNAISILLAIVMLWIAYKLLTM